MNAETTEQRREICDQLFRAWESAVEEVGQISLVELLHVSHSSDTALIEHLDQCYLGDGADWSTFDEAAIRAERYPKVSDPWDKIAETYKMNAADRLHVRAIVDDAAKLARAAERSAIESRIVPLVEGALSRALAKAVAAAE